MQTRNILIFPLASLAISCRLMFYVFPARKAKPRPTSTCSRCSANSGKVLCPWGRPCSWLRLIKSFIIISAYMMYMEIRYLNAKTCIHSATPRKNTCLLELLEKPPKMKQTPKTAYPRSKKKQQSIQKALRGKANLTYKISQKIFVKPLKTKKKHHPGPKLKPQNLRACPPLERPRRFWFWIHTLALGIYHV